MNGVYICAGQEIDNLSSGITKKILSQINSFEKKGFKMQMLNFDKEIDGVDKVKFVLPTCMSKFEKNLSAIETKLNWSKVSFVYIRRITFCKGFIKMLKNIKKINNNIHIIMEVPTYPLKGEYYGPKKILSLLTSYYSNRLYKYIDRIVTYSNDELIWRIRTIRISNSVNFEHISKKKRSNDLVIIKMIAVAVFSRWHGYDRIIKGLENYYKNQGKREIHLNLVGYGDELNKYKKMICDKNLSDYIHVLGAQHGSDLDEIYNNSNIALDAMGRFRSKIYYNSSLKGKEYGAKGLPIVSGVTTELDYKNDFPYYYRVPNDNTPIKIEDIIDFFDTVYEKKEKDVINYIREYNDKYFNFEISFRPVINDILERCIK